MRFAVLMLAAAAVAGAQPARNPNNAIVESRFIAEQPPTPSAHASTIAATREGLVAAWFGGRHEGNPDVGIWLSHFTGGAWSRPAEIATGIQPDGTRFPCWNPVLYQMPGGELRLYYKVGPAPARWWGMLKVSRDGGRSWSAAQRLPDGFLGPVKNKPVLVGGGVLIASSSTETTDRDPTWNVHFEVSRDSGATWTLVEPERAADGSHIHAIQPSVLVHADGRLQAVGRSRSGRVFATWSRDNGATWSPLELTSLPNPNAGTDALTLRDGRHLIVYNHTTQGRTPLNVALSRDGITWESVVVLENEPGEYSYPAVIQAPDGLIHVAYTWKRERIKHVVIDPRLLSSRN